MAHDPFILGEFVRGLDERYRVSIPGELGKLWQGDPAAACVLAKERPGALSLWTAETWAQRLDPAMDLVRAKLQAGRLGGRWDEVQQLGRLLSTRHRQVSIAGRGRLLVPDGFREFLGVEPGNHVLLVGAAVCIEIWNPDRWVSYLQEQIPEFSRLLDELSS